MDDMPYLVSDGSGLDEEIVGSIRPTLAGPLQVDDGIDQDVGNMDAFGT
jgi:hypothetical protein